MRTTHRKRMRRLLTEELLGELAPRHRPRLHEHLRSDAASRAEYDEIIEAFRALERRDVAQAEVDLVGRWLFEGAASEAPRRAGGLSRLWTIAAVTFAAAAAAVVVLRPQVVERDDYLGVRHGSGVGHGLALEALCSPDARGAEALRPATVSGCPRSGTLAFAYRLDPTATASGILTLFGIDATGSVVYYAPTPVNEDAIRVEPGRWRPLPMSIEIAVNHHPGFLRLYGVVTPEPLTIEDIDEAAARLGSRSSARHPWTSRLQNTHLGRLCASPGACPSAELTFGIYEDAP
jgi:predicted anti-sigma-YlaC factor YlaD